MDLILAALIWVQRLHHDAEMNFYEIDLDGQSEFFELQDFYYNPKKAAQELGIVNSKAIVAQLIAAGNPARIAPHFPAEWDCANAWAVQMFAFDHPWRELDVEFEIESKLLGKTLHFLDTEEIRATAEKQVTDSDAAASVNSVCVVSEFIKNPSLAKTYFSNYETGVRAIREQYRSGSETAIDPANADPAVAYRNQIWIAELIPTLKAHKSFVAVGVGHFFGSEGLIELLRAQGFQVQRVTQDPGGPFALTKSVGF